MSELVSAFAAYKLNSSKTNKKGGKGKDRAAGAKGKAGGAGAKGKAGAAGAKGKDKAASAGSKGKAGAAGAKSKTQAASSKSKSGAKLANGTATKPTTKKTTVVKSTVKATVTAKSKSAKNGAGKNKSNGNIHSSEVEKLVEQLMGDTTKKLTKAEEKRKKELEEYLVRQLEEDASDLGSEVDEEEDDDTSTGSESGSGSSDSDEYTDEYTLNSYGSSYTDETGSASETESVNTGAKETAKNKDAQGAASTRKRKSNEGITAKHDVSKTKEQPKVQAANTNDATESKKSKQAAEAMPSTSRKSLTATKTAEKTAEVKRRSVEPNICPREMVGSSTHMEVNVCARIVGGNSMYEGPNTCPRTLKKEPLSPVGNIVKMNSIAEGEKMFQWLLQPVTVKDFFAKYWEKNACLIKRQQDAYFSKLISFEAIDQMLLKHHVEFTKNIDITSYKNGVRETLNPDGRAMPPVVWDHYGQGCSIRLLNPQTFLPGLCTVNSTLQEYFHCLVGANAYLTPPNSQGFAPHYDDIEAFVLQIEGRKRWRLYKPRNQAEQLPRFSSHNFTQQEIGKPILEAVLEPGDVLYFPRGTIHQACTEPGYHSLHITLSVYQKQSYADLFEHMLPLMLKRAITEHVDMRRGLPLHTWRNAGIAYSDTDTKERAELVSKVSQLFNRCLRSIPMADVLDSAVDQVAKKFQHEALPPEILSAERVRTVFGSRSRTNERGECVCDYEIELRTNVRLLRAHILRLVNEEEKVRIYYYLDNSKEYCEYEPNFIEIEPQEAGSVEVLIKSYPEYVGVAQLPLESDERKIELATALWERGLLMTERPLN